MKSSDLFLKFDPKIVLKTFPETVQEKNKNECEIHSKVIVSQDYFDY